jgi:hypothetical protein
MAHKSMHWLNSNAGAIQALSSVAVVLLTGALFLITRRYVNLTHSLLLGQLEVVAARRRELRSQIEVLRAFLAALPTPEDQRLAGVILDHSSDLRDFPFNRFRALASRVSLEAGSQAVEAENHLMWLLNLIRGIRATPRPFPRSPNEPLGPESKGYDWKSFPGQDYFTHVRFAMLPLNKIVEQLDQFDSELKAVPK